MAENPKLRFLRLVGLEEVSDLVNQQYGLKRDNLSEVIRAYSWELIDRVLSVLQGIVSLDAEDK